MGWVAALAVVISALVSVGATYGTQSSALAQKVDRIEFTQYAAQADHRFTADSLERAYQAAAAARQAAAAEAASRRIEAKIDSTNTRLSRLICARGPSYCQ